MKRILLVLLLSGFISIGTYAQQDIFRSNGIISPDIQDDKSVIFRLAGKSVDSVTISGSWMPAGMSRQMTKNEDGIWTYATEPLAPGFYRYAMNVDGVRAIDPSNAHVIRDVASVSNVFLIEGGMADLFKVNDVPHGTVSFRWYDSPGNDKMRRLTVYTPPGYENSDESYPVLYLLHGIGGDEEAWIGSGRAVQILDNLIEQGKANPMIVVMPNGNVFQEAAPGMSSTGFVIPTFQLPNTMDGKFESTFSDIMKFINSNYRTYGTKETTAIAGLSMGGFHSANIALNYPNTFDYIGLFSAALNVNRSEPPTSPIYQEVDAKLEKLNENGYELYWMAIGKDDFPALLDGNEKFRNKLDSMGMDYVYKETTGGHTWDNWRNYLVEFVQLIFQ